MPLSLFVRRLPALTMLVVAGPAAAVAPVVLANRTNHAIVVTVSSATDRPLSIFIDRHDFTVLTVAGATTVSYVSEGRAQNTRVAEGTAYVFTSESDRLRLEPLSESASSPPAKDSAQGVLPPRDVARLTVKLLVDRHEPGVREGRNGWENRLRKRIAAASEVLERQCRVRLEVVAVEVWESSPLAKTLVDQVEDFERNAAPRPAQVAIGFCSRTLPLEGGVRIAAPPAIPLGTHLLIDESVPLAESQRVEVLVHELGHFLGAVHTKDANSVMRMSPGDGRSLQRDFRIGFDPLNALVINLVAADGLKSPMAKKLGALSAPTRRHLAKLYKEMARLTPEDQTVERYLRLLDDVPPARKQGHADPLVSGTRSVVAAVVSASDAAAELGLSGDRATEYCVRAAAAAAVKLPNADRASAFLLGLAVALDTSDLLHKAESTKAVWAQVETDDERRDRLKAIGQPTLLGRHSLCRHFVVAAALTSIAGSKAADPGGIVHDIFDEESAGRFSFSELSTELAGGAFARSIGDNPGRLETIAGSFALADYLPPTSGGDEPITRDEFNRRYGSFSDQRFRERETEMRRRIAELPAYRSK
jgi:hypothetical protein